MEEMVVTAQIEGLDNDVRELETEVNAQIPKALNYVGSEMTANLQEHVRTDWYEPWGAPKVYKRRTDYGGGTPLGDASNMDIVVRDTELEFVYLPTGEHSQSHWDERDGDTLIQVIQTNSGWSFPVSEDKQGRMIMPRPFWDNFVDEQEGQVVDSFIQGMERDDIVKEARDRRIDLSDSKILHGAVFSAAPAKVESNGEDDLPW